MHGLVLLDAADEVLRPAILWNDQRTGAECDEIREAVGPERLIEITGNDALTGFTAPKLVWVRDHEPEVWARVAHVLLPKDYVRLRLTGEHASTRPTAPGTILFDLAARDWSPEVAGGAADRPGVAAADVRGAGGHRRGRPRRPPRRPGCGPARRSWPAAATRRRTPSGSGAVAPGRRGAVARDVGRRLRRDRPAAASSRAGRVHAFCHAVPGRWHLMTVMLSAAGSLRWFRDALAPGVEFGELVGGGRRRAGRERRPAVPALPHRRAQPAPGSAGARRVRRADRRPRSAAPDAGGAGGRRVRPARRAGPHGRGRDAGAGQIRASAAAPPARSGARSSPTSSSAEIATVSTTEGAAYGAGAARGGRAPAGSRPSRTRPRPTVVAATRSPHPGPTPRAMPSARRYRELYPALAPTFHAAVARRTRPSRCQARSSIAACPSR